jgi:uncharacterized protein YndB with AHSA1/START domain
MYAQHTPHDFANQAATFLHTRLIPAPREQVFAAFSDPTLLARWWGPEGFTNTIHCFEPRAGGRWQLTMHGPDGSTYPNENILRELVAPERTAVVAAQGPKIAPRV